MRGDIQSQKGKSLWKNVVTFSYIIIPGKRLHISQLNALFLFHSLLCHKWPPKSSPHLPTTTSRATAGRSTTRGATASATSPGHWPGGAALSYIKSRTLTGKCTGRTLCSAFSRRMAPWSCPPRCGGPSPYSCSIHTNAMLYWPMTQSSRMNQTTGSSWRSSRAGSRAISNSSSGLTWPSLGGSWSKIWSTPSRLILSRE